MKSKIENFSRAFEGNPYGDLYIYLVSGRVWDEEESNFGEGFIGNWVEEETSFLFFTRPSIEAVSGFLEKRPELRLIDHYHFTYEQWQGGGLEPLKVENILITPPWVTADEAEGKTRILLDPGVVFGTGLHPTTMDCIRAFLCLGRETPLNRVLDLGTGTGILALTAAKLGAKRVLAVDLNPLCVKTARSNVAHNSLQERIQVECGRAEDFVHEPADLLAANIHYGAMMSLMRNGHFMEKKWFILSGLMRTQARDIRHELEKQGLKIIREWDHEMTWYTYLFENRTA